METIDTIEEIEYNGYTIKIYPDETPPNPREWDNFTKMLCKHRDYDLGDAKDSKDMTPEEIMEYVKRKDVLSLPLYLLDHSGLWLRTGKFQEDPGGWDTSFIGYITVTKDAIKKEMARPKYKKGNINPDLKPIKHLSKKDIERALDLMEEEVKTYSDYLEGNVYGYVIESPDGKNKNSCWGFYPEHYGTGLWMGNAFEHGFKYMIDECKFIIDEYTKEDEKEATIQQNVTTA